MLARVYSYSKQSISLTCTVQVSESGHTLALMAAEESLPFQNSPPCYCIEVQLSIVDIVECLP